MIKWKCTLLMLVLYLLPLSRSMGLVHQIVNGTLNQNWRIDLTLSVDNLKGVILHCIDSQKDQFGMAIVKDKNGTGVRLLYKMVYKTVPLINLCGCDPCSRTIMHLQIRSDKTTIYTRCNNVTEQPLADATVIADKNNTPNVIYPIPMKIANESNRIFIMIGNIGPYVSENNVTIFPLMDQMVGCVEKFLFNGAMIEFVGNSSKMRPSCQKKCTNNICNDGICKEGMYTREICDCHSTALNGPFCNRSLIEYKPMGNNRYKKVRNTAEVYLKMTWRRIPLQIYCLLEIVREYGYVVVWINHSQLMLDSAVVSEIKVNETNFVNVTFVNGKLIVGAKGRVNEVPFIISELTRINVGFSDNNHSCNTFQGDHDIDFNSSQLQLIQSGQDHTTNNNETTSNRMNFKYIFYGAVPVGCVIVLILFVILMRHRRKKELDTHIQKYLAISITSLNNRSRVYTESGIYGKVDDNCVYESIEDSDIYSTVNV